MPLFGLLKTKYSLLFQILLVHSLTPPRSFWNDLRPRFGSLRLPPPFTNHLPWPSTSLRGPPLVAFGHFPRDYRDTNHQSRTILHPIPSRYLLACCRCISQSRRRLPKPLSLFAGEVSSSYSAWFHTRHFPTSRCLFAAFFLVVIASLC